VIKYIYAGDSDNGIGDGGGGDNDGSDGSERVDDGDDVGDKYKYECDFINSSSSKRDVSIIDSTVIPQIQL